MKVTFRIHYSTQIGEFVYVTGNQKALGNFKEKEAVPLQYVDEHTWEIALLLSFEKLSYHYFIKNETGEIIKEWDMREVSLPKHKKEILLSDFWLSANLPAYNLNSKLFDHLSPALIPKNIKIQKEHTHLFSIGFRILKEDQSLFLLGDADELGAWNEDKAIAMQWDGKGRFFHSLDLANYNKAIAYKYVVKNTKTNQLVYYEEGEDRIAQPIKEGQFVIHHDVCLHQPKEHLWRGSAVAIPVFSLRSQKGLGVGEFLDIIDFGKWCKDAGFSMIQILPINDTMAFNTWGDSYPYSAISVYALHPMYLNLKALPYKIDSSQIKQIETKAEELNQEKFLQYNEVVDFKINFLKDYFNTYKTKILNSRKFKTFYENNKNWIKAYAAFSVLRDKNKTSNFDLWEKHQTYDHKKIDVFFEKDHTHFDGVMFYVFIQWQLHEQLSQAVDKLHKIGVTLKGDLPIGIYRYSVDAWRHPNLFHLDQQAGAPPDDFATQGQNWQFPTYNWSQMKKDDFQWWKTRFEFMARYFDAYRIDHILGFFRIWQIPMDAVQGVLGRFEPAIPVTMEELHARGIYLTSARLHQPYLPYHVIELNFGEETADAINHYFDYDEKQSIYHLKPSFATQRKILQSLGEKHPHTSALLDLASQVLFIKEDAEPLKLHPRHSLHNTVSYAYLSDEGKHALDILYEDYFFHRQEQLWKAEGLQKLPVLIKTTNMLTCGEDLGMVPQVVPEVMNDLAILSLYVQRMPKEAFTKFSHPANSPYLAVVSPSSHDTSTLRQWWKEDKENTQFFYNNLMGKEGEAPKELSPELLEVIIDQHIFSPAILSVIPLQEFLSLDSRLRNPDEEMERINIPSVFPHPWQYRMHLTIEDLRKHKEFTKHLKTKHALAKRI